MKKQLTKNFHIDEFRCKDGTPVPEHLYNNVLKLAVNLQVLRDTIKVPIRVNSGYRTETHNRKIGGARRSTHLTALASDIVVQGFTPRQVMSIIETLIKEGRMEDGGLKSYNSFVHYDCRGKRARW
jgi:uncharacterized protein YcbK (DUF882 family)